MSALGCRPPGTPPRGEGVPMGARRYRKGGDLVGCERIKILIDMKPLAKIAVICLVSGIIAGVITDVIFFAIFPSAWLFFIIPAVMGWSIDKFGRIPKDQLLDDSSNESLQKKTGWMCAGLVLFFILITVLPILFIMSIEYIIANVLFYVVCGLGVYYGYNRGVRCIMDAYYDTLAEEQG